MKTKQEATNLAKCMKKLGELAGIETVCVLTNMNEPLGYKVGNTLEIIEAVECLKNNMPEDVREIVYKLGAQMIKLAGKGEDINENILKIEENLQNGKAYQKFLELVTNQGGDISYFQDTQKFGKAKYVIPVLSSEDGIIENIDAEMVGSISVYVGAGRMKKEDKIDNLAGIVLNKKSGDFVKVGEPLAYVHTNDETKAKGAVENLKNAFKITNNNDKPVYIDSVNVIFKDANGNFASKEDGYVSYFAIPANSEVVNYVWALSSDDFSQYASYEFEVVMSEYRSDEDMICDNFEISSNNTGEQIAVEIKNNNDEAVRSMNIVVAYYQGDKIVGVENGDAYETTAAGATAYANVDYPVDSSYDEVAFDRYEVYFLGADKEF